MMRLRPHHLFCVQGFEGKGYDDSFTANMQAAADAVAAEPDLPVTVVDGPDDICSRCPHLHGERCGWSEAGEETVRAHDAALMEVLGLADGSVTSTARVTKAFEASEAVAEVVRRECSSCPWIDDCSFARRAGITGGQ